MDYFETTVLVAVLVAVFSIMVFILYDVGKDVVRAAQNERRMKKERASIPDNVIHISREKKRKYRAIR